MNSLLHYVDRIVSSMKPVNQTVNYLATRIGCEIDVSACDFVSDTCREECIYYPIECDYKPSDACRTVLRCSGQLFNVDRFECC